MKLALTILQYCGVGEIEINEYAEIYQVKTCKVFSEVKKSIAEKFNERLLSEEVALKISSDWDLYNAYHDIVSEKNINKGELISRYGTVILKKLSYIVERGFVIVEGSRYSVNEDRYSEFSGRSVFNLLSNAVKNESDQFDLNENVGTTRFWSGEISEEALKGLRDLKMKHHKEEVSYVNKHIKAVKEGGMRIINLSATTCIQRIFVICALFLFINQGGLFADPGQSGGGTDPVGGGRFNMRMSTPQVNSYDLNNSTVGPFVNTTITIVKPNTNILKIIDFDKAARKSKAIWKKLWQ